jgi:hypothetical protein
VTAVQDHESLRTATSVELWIENTTYEGEPAEVLARRLGVLAEFLDVIGKDADGLVAFCFLRKKDTGELFVSTKRRTEVNEQIEKYVIAQGWTGKPAVANANMVRSFLIHNGIPIGGKTWTGG